MTFIIIVIIIIITADPEILWPSACTGTSIVSYNSLPRAKVCETRLFFCSFTTIHITLSMRNNLLRVFLLLFYTHTYIIDENILYCKKKSSVFLCAFYSGLFTVSFLWKNLEVLLMDEIYFIASDTMTFSVHNGTQLLIKHQNWYAHAHASQMFDQIKI